MLKQWTDVCKPGDFKHPFNHCEDSFKVTVTWDYEQDKEVLILDGMPYDSLSFLSPDFRIDEQALTEYRAELKLNQQTIIGRTMCQEADSMEWEPHVL